jgi:hypothetical protein
MRNRSDSSRFAEELGDSAGEFASGDGIREEFHPEVEVDRRPFFAQGRVMENFVGLLDNFIRHEHRHLDGLETQWIDIAGIDGIRVYHNGFAEINGLEKCVSEAFVVAGVGDQVGVRVNVKQRIHLFSIGI